MHEVAVGRRPVHQLAAREGLAVGAESHRLRRERGAEAAPRAALAIDRQADRLAREDAAVGGEAGRHVLERGESGAIALGEELLGVREAQPLHVRDARETVMQQIVIAPGGHTGWHSHPGPAVALVKGGDLTLYSSEDLTCAGRTYTAGQAFVDSGQGHLHIARNLSQSQNAEVWITYFDVPVGGPFRLDAPDPGICGF